MKNITVFDFFLIIFTFLINSTLFFGQVAGGMANINGIPENVPSPQASSLGQYGQIQVSNFNGLPNINIPLYNQDEIDISLSYHASGIRPDNFPGPVGNGWSLNAGGSITRIVKGGVDEVVVSNYVDPTVFSYYNNYSLLDKEYWYSFDNMNGYYHLLKFNSNFNLPIPSPDEFVFNMNGISGSFFYNHKGEWAVKCDQAINIKIKETLKDNFILTEELKENGQDHDFDRNITRIFYGFELTVSDGTTYVFGKTQNSIEFNSNVLIGYNEDNSNLIATTWYLTKIISPKKRETVFKYERQNKPSIQESVSTSISYYKINSTNTTKRTSKRKWFTYRKSNLVYLKEILFEKGNILFNHVFSNQLDYDFADIPTEHQNIELYDYMLSYDNESHWKKLNNIEIKNFSGRQINNITFDYTDESDKRLVLNKITKYGNTNINGEDYFFYYNPIELPDYNSEKIDHWGYYNGVNYFETTGPAIDGIYYSSNQASYYHDSRSPDGNLMKAGILKKIVYPTKGFTDFQYEPHEYAKVVINTVNNFPALDLGLEITPNTIAGGLRIKKIISNVDDVSSPPNIREFFYLKHFKSGGTVSSGILSGNPTYLEEGVSYDGKLTYWDWNSYSIEPLSSTNGNHITYSNVVEKTNTGGGFIEYIYSNHDYPSINYKDTQSYNRCVNGDFNVYNSQQSKYMPYNSKSLERGKLLFKKVYSSDGSLMKEIRNTYETIEDSLDKTVRSLFFYEKTYGQPIAHGTFAFYSNELTYTKIAAYEEFKYFHYLSEQEEIIYNSFDDNFVSKIQKFKYNNYRSLEEHIFPSSNKNIIAKTYYSNDVSNVSSLGNNNLTTQELHAINKLKDPDDYFLGLNYTSSPIQIELYKDNNNNNILEKVSDDLLLTKRINYVDENNIILPKNEQSMKGIYNSNNNELEDRIVYHDYYPNGNLKQISKKDGTKIIYIYGYNQQYIVAKIENASLIELENLSGFSTDFHTGTGGLNSTQENTLRTQLEGAQITTYKYIPLVGITSITDSKEYTTFYEYDNFNRLKRIKNNNGNIIEEFDYNLQELTGNINSSSSSIIIGDDVNITVDNLNEDVNNYTFKWIVSNANLNEITTSLGNSLTVNATSSHVPGFTVTCEIKNNNTNIIFYKIIDISVALTHPPLNVSNISIMFGSVEIGNSVIYQIIASGGSGNYQYDWKRSNNSGVTSFSNNLNTLEYTIVSEDSINFTIECTVTDTETQENFTKTMPNLVVSGL